MAIQTINLTVPGGDTPRSANTKINANFTNTTHAASRLVGATTGSVVEHTEYGIGSTGLGVAKDIPNASRIASFNLNQMHPYGNILIGVDTQYRVDNPTHNPPTLTNYGILNLNSRTSDTRGCQIAWPRFTNKTFLYIRNLDDTNIGPWVEIYNEQSTSIYTTTTASGANVVVDSNGKLTRASSSERYKDIISPLELDDEHYADAMSLNPIIYRSKSEIDNPNHHYYSFSAEALGAYDPAFTLWRDTETVTDDEGNVTEQPLDERVAEGINLNAIVAFLHATNVKQGKLIKDLQDQVNALKPA